MSLHQRIKQKAQNGRLRLSELGPNSREVAKRMIEKGELAQQAHYCEMVADGVWPNSKNLECEK